MPEINKLNWSRLHSCRPVICRSAPTSHVLSLTINSTKRCKLLLPWIRRNYWIIISFWDHVIRKLLAIKPDHLRSSVIMWPQFGTACRNFQSSIRKWSSWIEMPQTLLAGHLISRLKWLTILDLVMDISWLLPWWEIPKKSHRKN